VSACHYFVFASLSVAACGLSGGPEAGAVRAAHDRGPASKRLEASPVHGPRFVGRFTADGRFAWSGSRVELRFVGTEVAVTLEDPGANWVEAEVDGSVQAFALKRGRHVYQLASSLPDGEHVVRITRRTEAFFEPSRFVGFSVPESAWRPSLRPARRLEVIGDSISAGYGVLGKGPECPFEAATESHPHTYGALAARALGADLHTEAWSGVGLVHNYDGDTSVVMQRYYGLILPTEPSTAWDFSQYRPHAVIVNLGTNDFHPSDPGPIFVERYGAFLRALRTYHPTARLYVALGSMLQGTEYDQARGHLLRVIAERTAAGDAAIDFIEFTPIRPEEGLGCQWHPSAATQLRMADTLITRLRRDLGW
jgi:hypothetical protein